MGFSDRVLTAIPTYNSEKTIRALLQRTTPYTKQILVIDDGSSDKTAAICESFGVPIERHPTNQGLSGAMASAFQFARFHRFTHLLTLDSDLQHPPEYIPEFLRLSAGMDLVLGNRFHRLEGVPSSKIATNLLASLITQTAFGPFIPDISCGYRLYRVAAFEGLDLGKEFEFIFTGLFHALHNRLPIAHCTIPALYFPGEFLSSRRTEIRSMLLALSLLRKIPALEVLAKQVDEQKDFQIQLGGIEFFGFYLSRNDSYLLQCDLEKALLEYATHANRAFDSRLQ